VRGVELFMTPHIALWMKPVIVRVKRKRDEVLPDELFLEGNAKKSRCFQKVVSAAPSEASRLSDAVLTEMPSLAVAVKQTPTNTNELPLALNILSSRPVRGTGTNDVVLDAETGVTLNGEEMVDVYVFRGYAPELMSENAWVVHDDTYLDGYDSRDSAYDQNSSDSNDENYYGNDYPDEEDSDGPDWEEEDEDRNDYDYDADLLETEFGEF